MSAPQILVLGAYGEAGWAVVHGLVARGLSVLASGRRPEALEHLAAECPGIETLELDVQDTDALMRATQEAGLVINCVGPYIGTGSDIARIAVSQGCSVLDLASEQEHYRRLQPLAQACREHGVTVLTGAGAYPGLSGLLLRELLQRHPGATAAELALVSGPAQHPGRGSAQSLSGLSELAHPHATLEGGELVQVRPGARRKFEFPAPFGERETLFWPQLEILEAAATATVPSLSSHVALGGRPLPSQSLLRAASWLRPTPGSWSYTLLRRALPSPRGRTHAEDPTTNHGAIVVRVAEGGLWYESAVLVTDLPRATAWLPVYAAEQWVSGAWRGGQVAVPMSFFDAQVIAEDLRHDEHFVVGRWNEASRLDT